MWYEPGAACASLAGPLPVPGPEVGPLDQRVRSLTQMIADRLAAGVARHREDWHMLQRMWLGRAGVGGGGSAQVGTGLRPAS